MCKSKVSITTTTLFAVVAIVAARVSFAQANGGAVPDDDLAKEVLEFITTPEENRLDALADQIVDEVYNEAQIARAKIVEIRLLLKNHREEFGPSTEIKRRVAYLEKRLLAEVRSDRRARLVRQALFISASALGGTTVAGAIGIQELQDVIEEAVEVDETLNMHQRRLDQAYFMSRSMPTIADRSPRDNLASTKIVRRDLEALGIGKSVTQGLGLTSMTPREVGFVHFEKTNLPGLSYAVFVKGPSRHLLFGLTPSLYGSLHAWVTTRALSEEELARLTRELAFRDVSVGGKDFAVLIDSDTREAFPTRLTMEQIRAQSQSWRQGLKYSSKPHMNDTHILDHLALYSLEGTYDAQVGSGEAERLYREGLLGSAKF